MEMLPAVRAGLDRLESAVHHDQAAAADRGRCRWTLLTSFLQIWLVPRIRSFRRKHPDIELRFHTSS